MRRRLQQRRPDRTTPIRPRRDPPRQATQATRSTRTHRRRKRLDALGHLRQSSRRKPPGSGRHQHHSSFLYPIEYPSSNRPSKNTRRIGQGHPGRGEARQTVCRPPPERARRPSQDSGRKSASPPSVSSGAAWSASFSGPAGGRSSILARPKAAKNRLVDT